MSANKDWLSITREVATSIRGGASLSIADLNRFTGASSERRAQSAMAHLRREAAAFGVEIGFGEDWRLALEGPVEKLLEEVDPGDVVGPAFVTERTARRRRIRALGLCVDCKDPALKHGLCERHYRRHRDRCNARRRELRGQNRCRECRSKTKGRALCAPCLLEAARLNRDAYRAKRLEGRCPCGRKARTDKVTCERCAERTSRRDAGTAEARERAGLCSKCGRAPPDGETKKCAGCRERHRVASLKSSRKKCPPRRRRVA